MDAVEFLKEYRRMCKKYAYMEAGGEDCSSECPFYNENCNLVYGNIKPNDVVFKIKQWSQSHPQKTMLQDFFEKFPNAPRNENGTPMTVCPSYCGYTNEPNDLTVCEKFNNNCLKCWNRLVED